ncbi:MAG: peptidase [Bdellovibrionaceae bacterium]|nr:peptidase [Bdellovibrionales bacterium]MCB9085562.1 peptidase [Pseudobdellovibrionaceae bacterium]
MSDKANRQKAESSEANGNKIVIDEANGLVFASEDDLYQHFFKEISVLEDEFFRLRRENIDLPENDFSLFEKNLSPTLEDPDEVWEDRETIPGQVVMIYLKEFPEQASGEDGREPTRDEFLFHVALCYMTANVPSFVYLHFPSKDIDLVEQYCRGELVYDRSLKDVPAGAIDGDALAEGDELAKGLYESMLKVRADRDIHEEEFSEFAQLREETVEEADEIWRAADSMGNVLVTFVKEFPDELDSGEMWYVVVTLEDQPSSSHALLFSFPSLDRSLIDRYRHGENLQAEEVVQESSH